MISVEVGPLGPLDMEYLYKISKHREHGTHPAFRDISIFLLLSPLLFLLLLRPTLLFDYSYLAPGTFYTVFSSYHDFRS